MSAEPSRPSTAAARLVANKERIISLWTQQLRDAVPAATAQPHPVLVDTLPAILDSIALSLQNPLERRDGTEGTTLANEHGGERVRLTHFRLEDVITEYRLLRQVLVEVLDEESLSREERKTLHASLDEALKDACSGFTLVQAGFRDQFFATLAHDLRNPLAAALTSATLILRRPQSDNVPRWAVRMVENIERVDRMLQDLLDAMRVQTGARLTLNLEACDVSELTHRTVDDLRLEYGDRFSLHVDERVMGHVDADALRRTLENLINNAVKYGETERRIGVRMKSIHGRLLISVHNDGEPIPAEKQETLFRAFQRLTTPERPGQQGWGLGLAQARAVAEAHGGSIGIDSGVDRGTTFTVDIPLDARPFQNMPVTPGTPSPSIH
jgi:signal transduction histidine kinase